MCARQAPGQKGRKEANAGSGGSLDRFEVNLANYLEEKYSWPRYTSSEVLGIRKRFKMNQEEFGKFLNVSNKTIMRWEMADDLIPPLAHIVLCMLSNLEDLAFVMMQSKDGRDGESQRIQDLWLSSMRTEAEPAPEVFKPADVKTLQRKLKMTRGEFSDLLGVSTATVDKWESGVYAPGGAAQNLLKALWVYGPKVVQ